LKVEDTYCEAFKGTCCRVIVTAEDIETVRRAAYDATSTPGTVMGGLKVVLKPGLISIKHRTNDMVLFFNSGTIPIE